MSSQRRIMPPKRRIRRSGLKAAADNTSGQATEDTPEETAAIEAFCRRARAVMASVSALELAAAEQSEKQ